MSLTLAKTPYFNPKEVMKGVQQGINAAVLQGLVDAGQMMIDQAKRNLLNKRPFAGYASGKLHKSFYIKVNKSKLSVTIGNRAEYALIMEFGRAPSNRMAPPLEIKDWLRAKGLATDAKTVFVMNRKMARYGIKPVRYMSRAVAEINPTVPKLIEAHISAYFAQAGIKRT
jgi:hypothetical protein